MGRGLVDISQNDSAAAYSRNDTGQDRAPPADDARSAPRPDIGHDGDVPLSAGAGEISHECRLITLADTEERPERLSRAFRAIRLDEDGCVGRKRISHS